MKYIKLFENFEGEDKSMVDELSSIFGFDVSIMTDVQRIISKGPVGIQKWFEEEANKEEPNIPVINELLNQGIEFDLMEENIFLAVKSDKIGLLKILFENGADINQKKGNGQNLLHEASASDSIRVATFLIDRGIGLEDTYTEYMWTALHMASWYGSIEVAKLLIERGAKIDCKDHKNKTPLHWAARYNQIKMTKLLLDNGANIEARTTEKQTPLHIAVLGLSNSVIAELLRRGADVSAKDEDQKTPWMLADYNTKKLFYPELQPTEENK